MSTDLFIDTYKRVVCILDRFTKSFGALVLTTLTFSLELQELLCEFWVKASVEQE